MKTTISILFCLLLQVCIYANVAHAYTDTRARSFVEEDLATPFPMSDDDRLCIDGTKPNGRAKIDYWVDFECKYCRVDDILAFQQANQNMCITVRHTPSLGQESTSKALTYEALLQKNANGANNFWHDVFPQNGIPKPYIKALLNTLDSLVLPIEDFEKLLESVVALVESDNQFSLGKVSITPTFVIENIRMPACDFTAEQLEKALPLIQASRNGDNDAKEKIISIVHNGLNNKPLF